MRRSYQGQEIAEIAQQMIEAAGAIRSAAAGDSPLRGTIRLGTGNPIADAWLPEFVRVRIARAVSGGRHGWAQWPPSALDHLKFGLALDGEQRGLPAGACPALNGRP